MPQTQNRREPWGGRPPKKEAGCVSLCEKEVPAHFSRRELGSSTPRFLADRDSEPPFARHKAPPGLIDGTRAQVIDIAMHLGTIEDLRGTEL
jgi:hypothetical protein